MKRVSLLLVLASVGCGAAALDWRNHASFRTSGAGNDIKIAQIEPGENVKAGISQNVHYVSIGLDTVFFRDLPGLRDRSVVMGVEVDGVLDDNKKLKGVLDVKDSVSKHAFLSFDNAMAVQPFLYRGRAITITVHFRAIPKSDVPIVSQATLSKLGAKLDPLKKDMVDQAAEKFTQVLGAIGGGTKTWSYSFTLYPPDSTHKDKPEMLFTATRHVLLAIPPADASKALRAKLNPYKLIETLKMRGNRLIDSRTGDDFVESPYIVLNITRFKRYPTQEDTKLASARKQADKFIEERNFEMVPTILKTINVEIANDKVLTQREKNLERAFNDIREVAVQAEVTEATAKAREKNRGELTGKVEKVDARMKEIEKQKAALKSELAMLEAKKETAKRLRKKIALKEKLAPLTAEEEKLKSEKAGVVTDLSKPWEEAASLRTKQLKMLNGILAEHAPILEPHEIQDTEFKIRQLASKTESLFQQLARDVSEVKAIVAELDTRIQEIKKSDESQNKVIDDLKKEQDKFRRDMETRLAAILVDKEKNSVRAQYKQKWYEKGWVWSLITVGTVGVTGTLLYFLVFKKPAEDTTPGVGVPELGSLTAK